MPEPLTQETKPKPQTTTQGSESELDRYSKNICLRLYVPVNNFSVILGRLPGFNQYNAMGMKCLAQGHNTVPQARIKP